MKNPHTSWLLFLLGSVILLSLALSAYVPNANTTNLPQIIVKTNSISDITSSSAACYFSVTDRSNTPKTIGVCVSKGPSPTISNTKFGVSKGSIGPINFRSDITGLTPAMKFYVRAYCTTASGTVYGSEISFSTLKPK
jgi:hypothetical protein